MTVNNVENQYIGLSPLTKDDIVKFFEDYIKPYAPYNGNKIYNTLMNSIVNNYCTSLYTQVPKDLKTLYEDANINVASVYDNLLTAIGVPDKIIKKISFSDKMIFLQSLNDFMRYKGTLSFVQKVAESFNERMNIYELYIDYDEPTSSWVFKPINIFKHDDLDLDLDDIPYNDVYQTIPSFLVNEESLDEMKSNDQLVLPIKSNLLFLDSDLSTDISLLYDVIVAIFLHTYKDEFIEIYFKDTSKTCRLKNFYFLWYYLLTEYYGIAWTAFDFSWLLRISYDDIGFPSVIGTTPTTIENLATIIDTYDKINSLSTRDKFYNDIETAFLSFRNSDAKTATDIYNELLISNPDLITYIDDRINSASNKSDEINTILTEMYSSLTLFSATFTGTDIYFSEYVDYFLKYLPQIIIKPDKTTTYTILYNLKPYHVDLYSVYKADIRCKDKFNQIYIDDEAVKTFAFELHKASVVNISIDYITDILYKGNSDIALLDSFKQEFNLYPNDENEITSDDSQVEIPTKVSQSDIVCIDSFNVYLS